MPLLRTILAALMVTTCAPMLRLYGQEPAGEDAAERASTPAASPIDPAVEALELPAAADRDQPGPDIFLLPDAAGKLRRVLGYRYEDFLKAWQAGGALAQDAAQPKFVLESLAVEATAGAESAQTDVNVEIELQSPGWVEVPLEMGALIVSSAKVEGGDDRDFVMFDAPRGGYTAWLKGKPGDQRTVVLRGQLVVQGDGEGRRLEVELPAAAASVVKVTAPSEVEVESPANALVTSAAADDGQTQTRIEGAKGAVSMRWGPRRIDQPQHDEAMEAAADAKVTVEPGRLSYEVVISLLGFGEPLDRARVRLPRGTALSSSATAADYEIVPLVQAATPDSRPEIEVRLSRPTLKPPPIRLTAEQPPGALPADGVLRAEGFEVVGAFRQRGVVAIHVSDQLHAHFERAGRVERIDPAELPEALRAGAPLAAFNTAGAGWSLDIHTQPRQRTVRVTPTYELHLGSQGAVLDVALDYQISGGRTFELRLNLREWELTEQPIESGGVVDLAEQHVTSDQILILPLKVPDAQQVRLRFSLRREAGLGVHDLPLPEARDAFMLPGRLTVTCDEAWRAAAQIENSIGVGPAAPSPIVDEATNQGDRPPAADPSVLELQTFLPRARLAVDVSEREQLIDVESIVTARLEGGKIEASQRLAYDISYQPAAELGATVGTDLLANEGLQLLLDGQPLPSSAVDIRPLAAADSNSADSALRLVVRLPRPTLGPVVLELKTTVALDDSQRSAGARIALPLAVPDQPAISTATVSAANGERTPLLAAVVDTTAWSPGDVAQGSVGGALPVLVATAETPVNELALRLEPRGGPPSGDMRLEASWAQTWIAGGARQDRYVYRFRTSDARVVVSLPTPLDKEPLEVLLNGEPATAERAQSGELAVALRPQEKAAHYTMEIRRHAPQSLGSWDHVGTAVPRIIGTAAGSPFFWQLILPREVAALATPSGLSPEYRLGWQSLYGGRQPTQNQADLERWTSAVKAPPPASSTNRYLYSAFEPPATIRVAVVRRLWLVVAASLVALGVGLTWLYTSVGRSLAFWLSLCVAAIALLLTYPEAAVVMAQAVCLGGVCTLMSVATKWLLADGRPPRPQPSPAASSIAALAATQAWVPQSASGSGVTASTAPTYHAGGSAP